jgi:hypothetical protein
MEVVNIRRQGYPARLDFQLFAKMYSQLLPAAIRDARSDEASESSESGRDAVSQIMQCPLGEAEITRVRGGVAEVFFPALGARGWLQREGDVRDEESHAKAEGQEESTTNEGSPKEAQPGQWDELGKMAVDDPKWQCGALSTCNLGECGGQWQIGKERIFLKDGMLGVMDAALVLMKHQVSSLQAHKLIQIYTNTDYCLVAFCTWILITRPRYASRRSEGGNWGSETSTCSVRQRC